MKVCMFTLGTRGDVQPYVVLGRALIHAGHSAVLCTGASFRSLVEAYGISFAPTSSDLMALSQTKEGRAVLEHPVKNLPLAMKLSREVTTPAYRKTLEEFWAAAGDADVILYHPKALGAVDIARYYGICCVSLPPVPITYPVSEFPNLALTTRNLGSFLNRKSYGLNALAEKGQMEVINDFRRKVLGLENRKAGIYAFCSEKGEIPTVYPVSPLLFPEVKSWEGHVLLPGFFFLEEGGGKQKGQIEKEKVIGDQKEKEKEKVLENQKEKEAGADKKEKERTQLPPEVQSFLEGGKKPVVITFSSMPLEKTESFLMALQNALLQSGDRAIVLTGSSGLHFSGDERILPIPFLPHSLLFPNVKGVMHHGGAGTMAEALRAGVPQVIIPFTADAPFWAKRLQSLSIGLPPIPRGKVSAKALALAFAQMEEDGVRKRAERMGELIRREDGPGDTVRYLEEVCRKKGGDG